MMRKAIFLLALTPVIASCGSGISSSSSSSEHSFDSVGRVVISVNFPQQAKRHISGETDFIRINLVSSYFSPESGGFVSNPLEEITLTPSNSTAVIEVPSGYIDGVVSLWDNDTTSGTPYLIGGTWIYTSVESGETKTLDVFIPSGIWELSSPLKGIRRIQVTEFPTNESFGWGNIDFPYVTFNPEWYSEIAETNEENNNVIFPIGGIVEGVVAETENDTLLIGNLATVPPFAFIDESKASGEFGIFTWSEEEGTNPIPIKGRFDFSNSSRVSLYWFDELTCEVNATLSNGTVVSFSMGYECEGILPTEAFNSTGTFNGTYEFDNVTACLVKNSDGSYFFVPTKECELATGDNVGVPSPEYGYQPLPEPNSEYYWVKNVKVAFSVVGLEKTNATISDLPLPWKNMAKITSFNATCVGESNCTYRWEIDNPAGHEVSCFVEMGNERHEVNCSDGNFTCSASNNCSNIQPVKFVVRDKAFVQPLADVKTLEEYYYSETGEEESNNSSTNGTSENVTGTLLPEGTNVTLEKVRMFLISANGSQGLTIFDDNNGVSCNFTATIDKSNETLSFILQNCSNATYNGNGTISEENGTIVIVDEDGEKNKVVYVDNNALLVRDSENQTISFIISQTSIPESDLPGSWKPYEYREGWEDSGECITFYDNGTFVQYSSNGTTWSGDYTYNSTQGQINLTQGPTAIRTIVSVADNGEAFIMNEVWLGLEKGSSTFDNRIWIKVDSCE